MRVCVSNVFGSSCAVKTKRTATPNRNRRDTDERKSKVERYHTDTPRRSTAAPCTGTGRGCHANADHRTTEPFRIWCGRITCRNRRGLAWGSCNNMSTLVLYVYGAQSARPKTSFQSLFMFPPDSWAVLLL